MSAYLAKIKLLLNERIGLNPDSVGESSIARAVNHRITALKLESPREYYKLLSDSAQECNELIEEVVVPETWFFRNRTPFEALKNYVKQNVLPGLQRSEKVRILSIPCSTGEEPYSIAMALLDGSVDAKRISIDAIDISKRALAKARRAIYGRNSFRDVDETIISQYFDKVRSGHHLIEKVRNMVNFKLGNFLIGSLSPHPDYYDVIFCRNLLIYFNRDIQQVALEKLYRSLKDTGILFVGHAETANVSRAHYTQYQHPHSFAYLKKHNEQPSQKTPQKTVQKPAQKPAQNKKTAGGSLKNADVITKKVPKEWEKVFQQFSQMPHLSQPAKSSVRQTRATLQQKIQAGKSGRRNIALNSAEQRLGEGNYEAALKICEKYLQSEPESADAYFLLGVIHRSSGDDKKSQSMLKKAIYLDPNHEQALALSLHMAKERGDNDAITSFNRRLHRVRKRLSNRGR